MNKILVVGSLAFDVIFDVHGNIKDEIPLKNGKIDKINLMFTAKNKKEFFGGTAGNIAYGLGQLGEKPLLFSVAGKDFDDDYKVHLLNSGVKLKVIEKKDEFTAVFYGISDENKQQIGIWQPNAYGSWINKVCLLDTITKKELKGVKTAIFSPGTGISTKNMIKEFRQINKKAVVIFDPSQILSIFFNKSLLLECLKQTNILISNDTEIAQLKTLFGLNIQSLLNIGISALIETKGGKGVTIYSRNNQSEQNSQITITNIPAVKPNKVIETTGAGDAFRSGLIYGLIHGRSIVDSCKIGTYIGAKCVEKYSGQLYTIKSNEIKKFLIKNL